MPRAKRGFKARRRRNRVLKAAKGFRGKRSSCHAVANEAVQHAWMHMYRSRKVRKRDFRSLWIQRINAAARGLGHSYSKLMGKLNASGIALNRKMLAEIAISDPVAFQMIATGAAPAAAAREA
jgi:large subunit ribosomal protein L20